MEFWDKFVDFLQVASILSAALFAALALFTEYKKDGKTTKTGRFAVVGIVLSALCSLGMQWGKDEIDRIKSEAAAKKEESQAATAKKAAEDELDRYRKQMDRLGGMFGLQEETLGRSEKLASQMEDSLRRQLALQAQVRGTLLAVDATRNQEQRNTGRVLQTMWDDANRISASSLILAVRYSCGPVSGQTAFPRLMAANVTATVIVASRGQARLASLPVKSFASRPLLLQREGYVEFESMDQRVAVSRQRSVDGDQVDQLSFFGSFTTDDLKGFDRPERWRDAVVEVVLAGRNETGFGDAALALKELGRELGTEEENLEVLREAYDVGEPWLSNPDFGAAVLDCPVSMTLLVNGRTVAAGEGRLVRVRQGDEDVDTLAVVKFPIVAAIPTAFPQFDLLGFAR